MSSDVRYCSPAKVSDTNLGYQMIEPLTFLIVQADENWPTVTWL